MARPKKGTPAGDEATKRWHETMVKRYGSVSNYMANVGRIGGLKGRGPDYKGGFASNKELAITAGAVGGRKSRRGPTIMPKIEAQKDTILEMRSQGAGVKEIADKLGYPLGTMYRYFRMNNYFE